MAIGAVKGQMSKQHVWLSQYYGHWFSTVSPDSNRVDKDNCIELIAKPHMNGNAMMVDVFSITNKHKQCLLSEMISYDQLSNQIVAMGQNQEGQCFIGKGQFRDRHRLSMVDRNLNDTPVMQVDFHFVNPAEVLLQGHRLPGHELLWEVKYIKDNRPQKSIGIQLVSVRDLMEKQAESTLKTLGRMGFSYVETFVFDGEGFYGMEPRIFKSLVESCGMKFKGSMVFRDLADDERIDDALLWWHNCIVLHKEAGVSYITTSNNRVNDLKNEADLVRLCEYYNAIGELCASNNIQFAIHNHTEEFGKVNDFVIYDYLLQNTNPDLVSFQLDLFWIRKAGADASYYFKNYPGRFFSWHVKDSAELGHSGKTDFRYLYQFAQQAGLKYNVFEIEQFNYHPLVSINLGINYLLNADFIE